MHEGLAVDIYAQLSDDHQTMMRLLQRLVQAGNTDAVKHTPATDRQAAERQETVHSDVRGATTKAREVGEDVSHQAHHAAEATKTQGDSLGHKQPQFFATQLGRVTAALHRMAQELGAQDQQPIAQYTSQAAEKLDQFTQTLRDQDINNLLGQVEDFARRQPIAFLGSAAMVGFFTARFLRRAVAHSHVPDASSANDSSSQP